jgi:DNA-binding CsgD family transcriptional regulator/N-acetylneuraminic acid mutarotase
MSEDRIEPLSERELELVRLLATGLSNKEIARELVISPNTVKVHLRNIYGKLKVASRTEASMVALRQGWIEIERSEEDAAQTESVSESASGSTLGEPVAYEVAAPLMRWQRIYLIAATLLVGVGLWLIWPRAAAPAEPFTDRPASVPNWLPGPASRWQSLAQMPAPRSRLAIVASEGRIYAIAGETAAGVSNAVDVYLPDEDTWVRGTDKPTAVSNVGAVAVDSKVYVPGGILSNEQMSDRLEIYDLRDASWDTGERLPRGICAYAISGYGGQLYLFGGWDGTSYVAWSYRYDPGSDTWEALAPMSTARAFAGAGAVRERIYVVGGFDGQDELDVCEVYDPQTDTWGVCPPMNAPRGGVGVSVIADTLYVIGGGWESYLVENEYYSPLSSDPTKGTWLTFPSPLLQEWRNLGVVANETTLYAIGGWDGEYLGVNQAYQAIYRLYLPSALGQGGGSSE